MKAIERVLLGASGLKRLFRTHNTRIGFVDFRMSTKTFTQAACALRITFEPDKIIEDLLLNRYPNPLSKDSKDPSYIPMRRR